MIRTGFSNTESYFIGTEVEHTPAFGLRTLFVIGLQDPADVVKQATEHQVEHIYFGANMSFPRIANNDWLAWNEWRRMIQHALAETNKLCTLDIDVDQVGGLTDSCLAEHDRFIPMISVKLPYIQQLGYNATIKLDDHDFAATNPGVWCHSVHSLQNRSQFTPWSKYTKDEIIK